MSAITVRGALAERYRAYRDLCEDFDRSLIPTYRATLLGSPAQADEQTIALVLRGQVRFAPAAREVFARAFAEDDAAVAFVDLQSHLNVTDGARELITALKQADRTDRLAEALVLLFIAANPKLVTIEEPGELPTEDDGADDSTDPPDKPPEGYGG